METRIKTMAEVFDGKDILEVPFYQREYVWSEDEYKRFLDDMEYVTESNQTYFLGSIIFKKNKHKRTIIDGQQRLTTWCIFAKAYSLKSGDNLAKKYLMRNAIYPVINHSKSDTAAFKKILLHKKVEKIDNPQNNKLYNAFNYFVDELSIKKINFKALQKNLFFVCLNLDEGEDEQQIFDTINSLGVRLTISDMLKNYLFSEKNIKSYEENWAQIFESDDETRQYWKSTISAGSKSRTMMDLFFDAYLQVLIQDKKYKVKASDKKVYSRVNHLFKSYQSFVRNYLNNDRDLLIEEMADYAQCFKDTFKPDCCKETWTKNDELSRLNVVIFGLDTTTLIPYVLFLRKYINENRRFMRMCATLESFIMRRMVVGGDTKNYNRFFTSLILKKIDDVYTLRDEIKEVSNTTMSVPDNEQLLEGFLNSKLTNKQTKGILFLIESGLRPANSTVLLRGIDEYSLEHLMPKKWINNWNKPRGHDAIMERDRIILTLGNLAIIPQKLNSSISDSSWKRKLRGSDNQPGLKECASGLFTMKNVINKTSWNETNIKQRAKWLHKHAVDVWKKL